jgi:hypothetical protein
MHPLYHSHSPLTNLSQVKAILIAGMLLAIEKLKVSDIKIPHLNV